MNNRNLELARGRAAARNTVCVDVVYYHATSDEREGYRAETVGLGVDVNQAGRIEDTADLAVASLAERLGVSVDKLDAAPFNY